MKKCLPLEARRINSNVPHVISPRAKTLPAESVRGTFRKAFVVELSGERRENLGDLLHGCRNWRRCQTAVGVSRERAALFEDCVHSGVERIAEFGICAKASCESRKAKVHDVVIFKGKPGHEA